jgi:transaldolase
VSIHFVLCIKLLNICSSFLFYDACFVTPNSAYLVSPFPGRILDWHRTKSGKDSFHPTADPGVLLVKRMYAYFKKYGYKTICMPSSWRPSRGTGAVGSDVDEILALAGVDEMTIPPPLLESLLKRDSGDVTRACEENAEAAVCCDPDFVLDEATYRAYWETDSCGREKLDEGIDAFTRSTLELREILYNKFAEG